MTGNVNADVRGNVGKEVANLISAGEGLEEGLAPEEKELDEDLLEDEILTDDLGNEEEVADDEEIQESDEAGITNINQLAEALETEESSIYDLEVNIGDDMAPVTISVLKDSYKDLARNRQAIETERQSMLTEIQTKANQAMILPQMSQRVTEAMSQVRSIQQAYESFDWETLEQTEPTQAMLQRQKMQDAYSFAVNEYNEAFQEGAMLSRRQANDAATHEKNETIKFIPEWADVKVATSELGAIEKMMAEYGFSAPDFNQISDHRFIRAARDLMLMKETISKAGHAKKELKKTPNRLRSGSIKNRAATGKVALGKKIKHATGSNDNRTKASAISELIS